MILLSFFDNLMGAESSAEILIAFFLAVLFLQSGIDKVTDWKGNLGWLQGHFKDSPLKNMVSMMLLMITIFELVAGAASAVGGVMLIIGDNAAIALIGAQLSALSILMLFFGQRMAKDYDGAATLVAYFIVAIVGIMLFK